MCIMVKGMMAYHPSQKSKVGAVLQLLRNLTFLRLLLPHCQRQGQQVH